jgi:hypothetical protein
VLIAFLLQQLHHKTVLLQTVLEIFGYLYLILGAHGFAHICPRCQTIEILDLSGEAINAMFMQKILISPTHANKMFLLVVTRIPLVSLELAFYNKVNYQLQIQFYLHAADLCLYVHDYAYRANADSIVRTVGRKRALNSECSAAACRASHLLYCGSSRDILKISTMMFITIAFFFSN